MSVAEELLSPAALWQRRRYPVTAGGHRTFVLDEGSGDPVVFLHGIPTQAFLWRDVTSVVARKHRVIAPDLLGFGFADRPDGADYSPPAQARFIEALLDELGIDRFTLVAHDYGALVAADIICRHPARVTNLVLTNTSLWREGWGGGRLTPLGLLRLRAVGETALRLARPFMLTQAFRLYTSDKARLTEETMQVYWHPFRDGFAQVLLPMARDARDIQPAFAGGLGRSGPHVPDQSRAPYREPAAERLLRAVRAFKSLRARRQANCAWQAHPVISFGRLPAVASASTITSPVLTFVDALTSGR
jgi:2-hydroxymuconate-semialdehyde hydrolase